MHSLSLESINLLKSLHKNTEKKITSTTVTKTTSVVQQIFCQINELLSFVTEIKLLGISLPQEKARIGIPSMPLTHYSILKCLKERLQSD